MKCNCEEIAAYAYVDKAAYDTPKKSKRINTALEGNAIALIDLDNSTIKLHKMLEPILDWAEPSEIYPEPEHEMGKVDGRIDSATELILSINRRVSQISNSLRISDLT